MKHTGVGLYPRQLGFGFPFSPDPSFPSSRSPSKLFQSLSLGPSYFVLLWSSSILSYLKASLPSALPAGSQWMCCYLLPAASSFSCKCSQVVRCPQRWKVISASGSNTIVTVMLSTGSICYTRVRKTKSGEVFGVVCITERG